MATTELMAQLQRAASAGGGEGLDMGALAAAFGGASGQGAGTSVGAAVAGPTAEPLTAPEADRIVEALCEFGLGDVAGTQWQRQREAVERLNIQAHQNVAAHSDDFVTAALISHGKVRAPHA